MGVSIIIVNYNTKDLLVSCIESIRKYCLRTPYEIIVVDNASTDDSVNELLKVDPNVVLISNLENKGFGTANNQGVRIAMYDYIFLLNSDTILESDVIANLELFMNDHIDCAGVTPRILFPDRTEQNTYGNFPTSTFFTLNSLGIIELLSNNIKRKFSIGLPVDFERTRKVPHILGVAMFLRKSIFDLVGGFDENFFLYFEETDLCYRISQLGYSFFVIPNLYIRHFLSKSSPTNVFKTKHLLRSRLYYFKKHRLRGFWIIKTLSFMKLIMLSIIKRDFNYLHLLVKIQKI